jgi:hypothetical protein
MIKLLKEIHEKNLCDFGVSKNFLCKTKQKYHKGKS